MTSSDAASEPKAQHYIPKFYLKGFTDENRKLYVYEKDRPIRESKPKKEAHRPDYYTHAERGTRDETAEHMLEAIESQVAPTIQKLANPQYEISPKRAGELYLFVAFMFARVPSWRVHLERTTVEQFKELQKRQAQDKEAFYAKCKQFETGAGKSLGTDAEKLRQFILQGEYEVVQKSIEFDLGAMFNCAFAIFDELMKCSYEVLYAREHSFFVTSDAPVITLQPDGSGKAAYFGMGFGWPNVEVYFPLNKRACLRLKKRNVEPERYLIPEDELNQINNGTMVMASQYLYAPQGYKKIKRLFDERGGRIRPGKESFLPTIRNTEMRS